MQYHKVELCGVNTAKLPVLKEKEKAALLCAVRNGDAEARQKMINGNLRLVLSVVQKSEAAKACLIEHNLRLVVYIAKKFDNTGVGVEDLISIGTIGLIKAIDNFNPDLGLKFSTYGQPMIIGEIRRFLRDNNALRVSRSMRDVAYKAMQAREQMQKELGRDPTPEQIAQRIGLPKRTVTLALESVVEPISLYEPVYNDGGDTICVLDQLGESGSEENWISLPRK